MNRTQTVSDMLVWFGVTAAGVVLLGVFLFLARKYALRGRPGGGPLPGQLTIEKLEDMRRKGTITPEEFSALRKAALGLVAPPAGKVPTGLTEGLRDDDENRMTDAAGEPPPPPP